MPGEATMSISGLGLDFKIAGEHAEVITLAVCILIFRISDHFCKIRAYSTILNIPIELAFIERTSTAYVLFDINSLLFRGDKYATVWNFSTSRKEKNEDKRIIGSGILRILRLMDRSVTSLFRLAGVVTSNVEYNIFRTKTRFFGVSSIP
jgi:hypothetical protein